MLEGVSAGVPRQLGRRGVTPLHVIEPLPRPRLNPGRALIAVGCLYELAALPERSPLPTITKLVRRMRHHRVLRVAAFAWCVLVVSHFVE
jgi:hypothetical protein